MTRAWCLSDVDEHWEDHLSAHWDVLFSGFGERTESPEEMTGSGVIADDGASVAFNSGEGLGGKHPEFHCHISEGITVLPYFCPFCVFSIELPAAERCRQ